MGDMYCRLFLLEMMDVYHRAGGGVAAAARTAGTCGNGYSGPTLNSKAPLPNSRVPWRKRTSK